MPTVLITGANRGIGLAFVKAYLEKGYRVIAACRDVTKMPQLDGLVVVTIDSESLTDAEEAMVELEAHGITKLDIVIANAGRVITWDLIKDVSIDHFDTLYRTNLRGPLILFQAVQPLLSASRSSDPPSDMASMKTDPTDSEKEEKEVNLDPIQENDNNVSGKFVVLSSTQGCISKEWPPHMGAYGITKAAVNYLTRKIHFEHPELVSISLHPGHVDTDMGYQGARWRGWEKPPMTLEGNLPGMLKAIDDATKQTTSGRMVSFDGTICDW